MTDPRSADQTLSDLVAPESWAGGFLLGLFFGSFVSLGIVLAILLG